MSQHQFHTLVSLVSGLLVFAIWAAFMHQHWTEGRFEGPEAGAFIGRQSLFLIAASIVGAIVANILAAILHGIVTRNCETEPVDERDRRIELEGTRLTHILFAIGFVLALNALAFGFLTPPLVILAMIVSMCLASLAGGASKLLLYGRGLR